MLNGKRTSRGQRGLSMVELMVGVAVGLFVVAGATVAVSNQLGDNRRLMLETQVQQDLRAAADVIARDIRRSGHWDDARTGVWYAAATGVSSNPHTALVGVVSGVPASGVQYSYQRNGATEQSGFRLNNGAIQMLTGAGWQALTDSTTLRVTKFEVTLNSRDVDLACFTACAGAPSCPPKQSVRDITVVIEGAAVHDPAVRRGAQSNARLRNDVIQGACPV